MPMSPSIVQTMRQIISAFIFIVLHICVPDAAATAAPGPPDLSHRFLRLPSLRSSPREYLEVTHPLPSDDHIPTCAHLVLKHSFANTIARPPVTIPYEPLCSPPWSNVVLSLTGSSSGDQYDRISSLWLGGAELLRTSTPEPNPDGISWNVRKDITAYSALLRRSDLYLTMMLENIVNEELTGVFHINVTFVFYNDSDAVRSPSGLKLGVKSGGGFNGSHWSRPADVIIPVSNSEGGDRDGFWFRIESEKNEHSESVVLPRNTARAVMEVFVSFHGNDEFWYSNPPDAYLKENNLTTRRGNGAFRNVVVMIDGALVASISPFPVIFTGGINPLFWEPVVAIGGAFDLPSYKIELTPVLAKILDGKEHKFAIGVLDGISYWLVDANLHLWLDTDSEAVLAGLVLFNNPRNVAMKRKYHFQGLNGSFAVRARMKERYMGWVNTSIGNFTTLVSAKYKLKNSIKFEQNGTYKSVQQKMKWEYEVKVKRDLGELLFHERAKKKYPLRVITSMLPGLTNDSYLLLTNVSHAMKARNSGDNPMQIETEQDSNGWMEVKDHNVLSGTANTTQSYSYIDGSMCYSRMIAASNGTIVEDKSAFSCASAC